MPPRRSPIAIELLILFELVRGGPGHGPLLLRRTHKRLGESGIKLHYGTYYPALVKLESEGLVASTIQPLPWMKRASRPPRVYALTEEGAKEARRLSAMFHKLILPLREASV